MSALLSLTSSATADGISVGGTVQQTGGILQRIAAEPLADTATNVLFNIAFPVATLKGFSILSSQNCTIQTNSSTSPGNVITLVGGRPLVWDAGSGFTNPFTADVTKLYITNDSNPDAAGTIDALFLNDITP